MQCTNPLEWPKTQQRAERLARSQFSVRSLTDCLHNLEREVHRLGGPGCARDALLTCNVSIGINGKPYARDKPVDVGVALYFEVDGKPVCLACDFWSTWRDNVHAIVKHIEAMRGQERWGVGDRAQAFLGYAALPPHIPPHEVLGIQRGASHDLIKAAWRSYAKKHHPDAGGTVERFTEGAEAYAELTGTIANS